MKKINRTLIICFTLNLIISVVRIIKFIPKSFLGSHFLFYNQILHKSIDILISHKQKMFRFQFHMIFQRLSDLTLKQMHAFLIM